MICSKYSKSYLKWEWEWVLSHQFSRPFFREKNRWLSQWTIITLVYTYFLPKNMPKNTYYTQKYTYWRKYLFLEVLPQKPCTLHCPYYLKNLKYSIVGLEWWWKKDPRLAPHTDAHCEECEAILLSRTYNSIQNSWRWYFIHV